MLYEHGAKVMLETKQLCRKFERKHLCSGLLYPKYCRAYNCQPERAPESSLVVLNAVHLDLPWRLVIHSSELIRALQSICGFGDFVRFPC